MIDLATGWKINLIIRKSRAFSHEEFRRRERVSLHDVPLFLASAEDVVISKLEWAKLAQSRRQIEDAATILRVRWDALDHPYLEKWIGELGLTGGDRFMVCKIAAPQGVARRRGASGLASLRPCIYRIAQALQTISLSASHE